MKANELQRWDLVNEYDSYIQEIEEGDYVLYSDAMQVITALEAKIKGMIDRPKVHVYTVGGTWWYPMVNDFTLGACDTEHHADKIVKEVTKVLGMDDSTNPKEPQ